MTYEQLHFAFGALIPFIISFFYYDSILIFYFPLIMTLTGFLAALPFYFNVSGSWTNIFFLYDIINKLVSKGQFIGYFFIVLMFTIVLIMQSLYLWRNNHA